MIENETITFPKALLEVWEMKEALAKEMEGKTWEERKASYHQAVLDAAEFLNMDIVRFPNGTFKFVKKQ